MALESFNAYHSYLKSIEPLNDAERGRLFTALLFYSSTGEAPDLRGNERFVFPTMKAQIDRDKQSYETKCKNNQDAANMRWHPNECERTKRNADYAKDKDKDKDKDKNGVISTAPEAAAVLTLTLNDKSEYPITQTDIDGWQELFPAVDVMQELREMKSWCNENPTKRKTRSGVRKFINTWLSKEQDRGGRSFTQQPKKRKNGFIELIEKGYFDDE